MRASSGAVTAVGTIISAGSMRALVVHGEPPVLTRVLEGQDVEGWTVKSIFQDKIVLARAGATIELKVKGNPTLAQGAAHTGMSGTPQAPAQPSTKQVLNTTLIQAAPATKAPLAADEVAAANDTTLSQSNGRARASGQAGGGRNGGKASGAGRGR